jgi:ATPase
LKWTERGSTILQIQEYRIVIVRPPFSDGYEITAVRPVKNLDFDEYELPEILSERLLTRQKELLWQEHRDMEKVLLSRALQ